MQSNFINIRMKLPQAGDGDKVYVNSQIHYLFENMMIMLNCYIRYISGKRAFSPCVALKVKLNHSFCLLKIAYTWCIFMETWIHKFIIYLKVAMIFVESLNLTPLCLLEIAYTSGLSNLQPSRHFFVAHEVKYFMYLLN